MSALFRLVIIPDLIKRIFCMYAVVRIKCKVNTDLVNLIFV